MFPVITQPSLPAFSLSALLFPANCTILFVSVILTAPGSLAMKRLAFATLVLLCACFAQAGEKRVSVPLDDSPAIGPANAPVTIVEFLDFQ
jgi:hypothetical protein